MKKNKSIHVVINVDHLVTVFLKEKKKIIIEYLPLYD